MSEQVRKVVVSLGGAFLKDAESIKGVANALNELSRLSKLCVVAGGGERARECIEIARELGANDAICDYIGIAITRINAKLLILALKNAYPEPFQDYRDAAQAFYASKRDENGFWKVVVMGGVSPGHTTDAVAAILAEYLNADLLLNVTTVDGVYEEDPKTHPNARKYERLTPSELTALVMRKEMKAGSRIVIDPVAAKIIERSGIKTVIVNGKNPENILKAFKGEHVGTLIAP